MDRQLSTKIIRQRSFRNLAWGIFLFGIILTGFYSFRNSLKTVLNPSKFRTAIAQSGTIENTITATGEVLPKYEQVITSSIDAEIKELLIPVGSRVQANQPILKLNKEFALLKKEKLKDELSLKENSIVQLKLQLDKNLHDLRVNNEIKSLRINGLKADLEDAKKLVNIGGGTQEAMEKVQLNLQIAQLEKKQLENDLEYQQKAVTSDVKALELQTAIQHKDLQEFSRKLEQAQVLASRAGVLTWVNEKIGTMVNEGEALARIADLASFRVEGAISDIYSEKIHVGQSVLVRINDQDLKGLISNIKPTVTNGVIQFVVKLQASNHELLRPNLKVEVFLITQAKSNTIRVENGPAFKGRKQQFIYVLENGIAAGDVVIITDMTDYEHLEEVVVNEQ